MMMTIGFAESTVRRCGDCQLCCKLLPVRSLGKLAGERCKHQKFGKGCAVYHRLEQVSPECRLWTCRWLVSNDTAELSRPDRAHYVVDVMPDFVRMRDNETGEVDNIQVVQIWVDPKYPDAHRDPTLRAYLERRAEEGIIGLVRWSNTKGMAIFPPALSADRQWHEQESGMLEDAHSPQELIAALSGDAA